MQMNSFAFDAIGTSWTVDIYETISEKQQASIKKAIQERIEAYDKTYSRFRKDSLVTHMSQHTGKYELPEDSLTLLSFYKKLYEITGGIVTPLIGDVLIQAGYDAAYSLQPRTLHSPSTWDNALSVNERHITIKKPVVLDFGAAGKGYLIDIIATVIEGYNINYYCIDGSGDILYKNKKEFPLRIGLEHPDNPRQVIGVATLEEGSLCGSAGNRRAWDKYNHMINPYTLESPTDVKAVWTIAKSALQADGLATCLFFVEPEKIKKHFTFEYVILRKDYTITKSTSFPGEFYFK